MCVFCSKCWHPSRVALLWLGKQLSKRCGGYLDQLLIWLGLELVLFSSLGCSWMTFISIDEFLWCIHFCGTVHVECTTVVSGECRFLTPPQFKNAIIEFPFHSGCNTSLYIILMEFHHACNLSLNLSLSLSSLSPSLGLAILVKIIALVYLFQLILMPHWVEVKILNLFVEFSELHQYNDVLCLFCLYQIT